MAAVTRSLFLTATECDLECRSPQLKFPLSPHPPNRPSTQGWEGQGGRVAVNLLLIPQRHPRRAPPLIMRPSNPQMDWYLGPLRVNGCTPWPILLIVLLGL